MADNEPRTDQASEKKSKRTRGAFPRLPLKEALPIAQTVQELGHGDPVRRRTVFEHLKKSPDSSTSATIVQASSHRYGLTKGGSKDVYLELTPIGARIAQATNAQARLSAIHDLLFSNPLFAAIVDKFNDRAIPPDEIATDFLQRTHGLSEPDAKVCWSAARQNMLDYGLTEESGGKRVVVSRDHAKSDTSDLSEVDEATETLPADLTTESQAGGESAKRAATETKRNSGIVPQLHFNIQVVLPENASPETYDSIFQSIAKHLLGRDEA